MFLLLQEVDRICFCATSHFFTFKMEGESNTDYQPKYTVLLPTYNESQNLPYILWLLNESFEKAYVDSLTKMSS